MRARAATRLAQLLLVVGLLAAGTLSPAAAEATEVATFPGPSYSADFPDAPTRGENQSKVWFAAGAWWALMLESTGRTLRVFELLPDHTWRPTSAVVNSDTGEVGDALPDGDTVHVLTRASDDSLLYVRLSFDAAARDYRVAPAVLVTTRRSGAPATLVEDAVGTLWVGYATATSVVVTSSLDGGATWGRVITLATIPGGHTAEAAAMVAYDDRVGILWSNQVNGSFEFASHRNGDDSTIWTREIARSGPAAADNHIDLIRVPGIQMTQEPGTPDTLVAAIKSSNGDRGEAPSSPLVEVLVRSASGVWSTVTVSTVADGLNNPVVQVDLVTRTLRIFASRDGSIVQKTAPLDAIAFPPGIGSVFVNGADRSVTEPTVTRQPLTVESGLIVLASDTDAHAYRHAEMALAPTVPVADPTDVTPPTTPGALHGDAVSPESAVLSWGESNDGNRWVPGSTGVPVAGYIVSRDGAEIASVTDRSLEDPVRRGGDTSGPLTVTYSVVSVDASGNRSAPATLTVELPAAETSRLPLLVGGGLVVAAVVLAAAYLLYRRQVVRRVSIEVPGDRAEQWTGPRTPVG